MPPTAHHEALHRVFREDEALFARAIALIFQVPIPAPASPADVTVLSTDLTETKPLERRPDSVLQVQYLIREETRKYIVVLESQTDPDRDRLRRWPHFISHLHDKYDCPVILAVVCSKDTTADWARNPIEIGFPGLPSQITRLVVFGPGNVPVITSPDEAAADPTMAILSALTHSSVDEVRGIEDVRGILEALAAGLAMLDEQTAANLAEFTEDGLGGTAGLEIWRALMATSTYPFASQLRLKGREEGREEGQAEGRAASIFTVLESRNIDVDDDSRERIESCADTDVLDTWLRRALIATKVTDLFSQP